MSSSTEEILRQSGLFENLDQAGFEATAKAAYQSDFPADTLIAREGDWGDRCYIILDGTVEVFTTTSDQREVVLAKNSAGEMVGEQSLMPGGSGRRSASLRAFSDVAVLSIPKRYFQMALEHDGQLKQRLIQLGEEQIRDKLHKQAILFHALPSNALLDEDCQEETFADGMVVFHEGDPGDKVYFIVSGEADLFRDRNGEPQHLIQIGHGGLFGELALLERQPREATVKAHGTLTVLAIGGNRFLKWYEQNPELRELLQTLKKIYPMSSAGFVTQYAGQLMGMVCITTVYALKEGGTFISSQVIGQDIFNMALTGAVSDEVYSLRFQDSKQAIERELKLSVERRIVGVTARGHWSELGKIYRLVLDQTVLDQSAIDLFQNIGLLFPAATVPEHYQDDDILCNCMQVNYGQIRRAVGSGIQGVDQLTNATGAGSVCGSCRFLLNEVVGEVHWTPVKIDAVIDCAEQVCSFRFKPADGTNFAPARAGQHLILQARINGQWMQRPYSITSEPDQREYREITVKQEQHGRFTSWLFDRSNDHKALRISNPQGDFVVDQRNTKPIVCLVSGIGITPALAFCRALICEACEHTLHIDYSASTKKQLVCHDELRNAGEHPSISVNLRLTRTDGRITAKEIKALTEQFPAADYFICGPSGFEHAVSRQLANNAIADERIHIEQFTPTEGLATGKGYLYLGLLLLVAFIIQDLFQIKWPWLETLQDDENYRIGSGIVLALYVAAQFILPMKRWSRLFVAARRHYRLHKWQGAAAPLLFFFHTTHLGGYGYLLLLSVLYFSNFMLGLLNPEIFSDLTIKKGYVIVKCGKIYPNLLTRWYTTP